MEKFKVKEVLELPKMGLRALKLQHTPTNLIHLHVEKKGDANRVFSLAFKTDAPDKTGVPHILEHTTLCGSEKFPVRDPFFKMLTRSLANFMNALTGFDYTYYPFATTNKADFANLQRVYMDSVFSPLLKEQDFQQEGWRLEPAELAKGEQSPLIFKGVVYNEMKGQMSIPAYQHYMSWFMSVYPSMQYSAGDPLHIPELRYEDLVRFHKEHYHPGNCFTFSYGDFPAEEALEPLNEYLDKTQPVRPAQKAIPEPIELTDIVQRKGYGPVDPVFDINRQHKISLTWYAGDSSDLGRTFIWRVLAMLLTDGHASPMYQALIDSGIGSEFSVNTGFEETPAKLMFTIGLQGIEKSKIPAFKEAVFATVEKIIQSGFPQHRVDALLHQAEFGDREVDANYGMNVLSKVMNLAFHPKGNVMETLDNEKLISTFKNELRENPRLFQSELERFIGRNRPYFEYELEPSASFEADLAAAEEKVLDEKLKSLSDSDKRLAISKAEALEKATSEPQNLDILPTVTTSDISRQIREFPVQHSKLQNGSELITRETSTQGISYVRMMRDISNIPKELIPYMLLYTDAVTNVGTTKHTMAELEDLVKLRTGNLSVNAAVRSWGKLELAYGASALDSNVPYMYDLLTELASSPRLDNVGKLKVVLDNSAANITNSLSQSGHRYAISRAGAALNENQALGDMLSGFSFVKLVQRLAALDEGGLTTELVPKLADIHATPWSIRALGITHSPSTEVHESNVSALNKLVTEVGATAAPPSPTAAELYGSAKLPTGVWELGPKKTMVSMPSFQVSHVGAAVQGSKLGFADKDAASLEVLANLLTHRFLHTEIREKGGAYGGGASYNATSGLLSMFSYRDPTPENSMDVMRRAGTWAANYKFTDRDVEEGKISIFQSVDSPISPRNEISRHLGLRVTDEERMARRQNLLSVTASDLTEVAKKYLEPNLENGSKNSICVIGPGSKPDDGWSGVDL